MATYNPRVVNFQHTTQFVDGTPFTAADYAGLEFGIREALVGGDFTPTVAVPVTFDQTSVDISVLDLPRNVELELAARTVARNGTSSDWSSPSGSFIFDERIPAPPVVSVV